MNLRLVGNLSVFLIAAAVALPQGIALPSQTLHLMGTDIQSASIPAGSTSTLLPFTVEHDTTGGHFFDVTTSDAAVVISIILPSGSEVTSSNAASNGFTFTTVADGTNNTPEIPSILSFLGTHTVIALPTGQASGVYQIKANAASSVVSSGLIATYFSASTVKATATTDSNNYAVGSTVILSGLVFDGTSGLSQSNH